MVAANSVYPKTKPRFSVSTANSQEQIEKRGRFEKQYKNPDGSITSLFTPGISIHYYENHQWNEINTEIEINRDRNSP
jgi:hypothetical protein